MVDVTKRLLLAAESLKNEVSESEAATFAVRVLLHLGITPDEETTADQGNKCRSGHMAAPAPGGHTGDTGHYPSTTYFRAELAEVQQQIDERGDEQDDDMSARLRRVAELVELLEGEEAALPWWNRAAQAGDHLAAQIWAEVGLACGNPSARTRG